MKFELWKLADIKPYEKNPRHNDEAVAAVAASIKEFGCTQRPPDGRRAYVVRAPQEWRGVRGRYRT